MERDVIELLALLIAIALQEDKRLREEFKKQLDRHRENDKARSKKAP